jgi:uncharacterized protein with PIN domain
VLAEARYGAEGLRDVDLLVQRAGIELVPVDAAQARSETLLFKGDDFGQTDIVGTSEMS